MPETERLATALSDRYRIEREIGAGGMATVYLARDLKHDREVALKVLRPELGAVLGSERFLSEIRISARLDHPHILTLIDSGESSGFLWYVLPFVRGESLRAKLDREKQLSLDEALSITRQIASALDYAHQHGVVHRDIKPENILIHEGEAMLADFGIAIAVKEAGGNRLTETGLSLGTPQYMSPEQATGDRTLDARSDVYSLGAVLYEMLAGEPPVTGPTVQAVIAKLLTERPTHLRVVRDTVPEGVDAAVAKALSKVPADRFAGAKEFQAALGAPRRSGATERTRPRWLMPAAIAAVLLLGVAIVLSKAGGSAAVIQPDRVQITFTGNARFPSLSPDGRRVAFATRQCAQDGRCTVDLVIQDVGGAGAATVVRGLGALWDIEWTPDQRYLVFDASYGSTRWGAFSVPTLGGAEPRHLGCCGASLIPDTDSALLTGQGAPGSNSVWVRTISVPDGVVHDSVELLNTRPGSWVKPLADQRRMVVFAQMPNGLLARLTDRLGAIIDTLFVVTTGDAMGGSADDDAIVVFQPRSGSTQEFDVVRYPVDDDGIDDRPDTVLRGLGITNGARLTPNGPLAIAAGPTDYSLWSLISRQPGDLRSAVQRQLASGTAPVSGSLSEDGGRVLVSRIVVQGSQRRRQLSLVPVEGGTETPLGTPLERLIDWDWGADPANVVIAQDRGGEVVIADLSTTTGRSRERLRVPSADYAALEAGPAGGLLVIRDMGRKYQRVGLPGFADSTVALPVEAGYPTRADFAPDGRSVATIGWDANSDSILVQRIQLADGSAQLLASFSGEGADAVRWLSDGTLIFGINETEGTLAWYRMPAAGGRPVRVGTPPRYPASYRFSADGRTVLIRASNDRPDIYLIRNFGELLGRR